MAISAISAYTSFYSLAAYQPQQTAAKKSGGFAEAVSAAGSLAATGQATKSGAAGNTSPQTAGTSKYSKGSVLAEYYKKRPENKPTMEKWKNAGYSVLSARGLDGVDTASMSMSEYKEYIGRVIDSIPFDATRPYDEETINISEDGWEAMKNDPDYEAWVLGYIKTNRSVKNPFLALGDKGSFGVESFGASPEERKGYSFSKIYGGTAAGARSLYNTASHSGSIKSKAPLADTQPKPDYDLWEEKRRARKERQKELLEEELEAKRMHTDMLNELWEHQDIFDLGGVMV